MPRDALRIEVCLSRDAIDLIDAFRAQGLRAGLADTPGTWDVEVSGTLGEIEPLLGEWLTAHDAFAAAVHVGEHLYVVQAVPEPAREALAV